MSETIIRRLLLLVWLPVAIFLFPLPPQAADQLWSEMIGSRAAAPAEIVSELWVVWTERLVLLVLGISVGILAWNRQRHWRLFALAMSVLCLGLFVLRNLAIDMPVPESLAFRTDSYFLGRWQLNVRLIEAGLANGSLMRPAWILYSELLMPIFQAVVLAWMLWFYSIGKRA